MLAEHHWNGNGKLFQYVGGTWLSRAANIIFVYTEVLRFNCRGVWTHGST